MGGGGKRETFCTPVIRSQSFSEPMPLGCEFYTCFSVHTSPLHPLRWDRIPIMGVEMDISLFPHGRLELAGVGYFPPLGQLDS